MSFKLPVLVFSEICEFQPNKLIKLAQKQKILNPQILPKMESILSLIKAGRADQVTDIEWIYCIHTKVDWDEKHPDQAIKTSQMLWKTAKDIYVLRRRLLWHLALHYSEKSKKLAVSFVESFSEFRDTKNNEFIFLSQIIDAIGFENHEYLIVKIAHSYNLTQKELKYNLRDCIPDFIEAINNFSMYVSPVFLDLYALNNNDIIWFIKCLEEMPVTTQVNAISYFLENCNIELVGCHITLVKWLQDNYDLRKSRQSWEKLSGKAKIALRKIIGAVSYSDFQKWVNKILCLFSPLDNGKKQLNTRKEFWSNYSDRFERIRILIPQSSLKALNQEDITSNDLLLEDGSDKTEVCIFDFGDYFVVEFFRGSGSETRIFAKTNRLENLFFNSSKLSAKQIRCQGGQAHDHVYLWQSYCEKWLREKYNICPNPGIKHFKGVPEAHNHYDPVLGLKEPSLRKQQERNLKLEKWRQKIEQIEQSAKAYCAENNINI